MPVELRKRKTPSTPAPAHAPAKKQQSTVKKAVTKAKEVVMGKSDSTTTTTASDPPKVGETIALEGFGGSISTQEGKETSLKGIVDESDSGVVIFTYPKASTPGCTNQACLFRDSYSDLKASGLSVFGLSGDSPKANTTFKTKQNLPYDLLCDPSQTLIKALGFKKAPSGTTRGVFVVDKEGKVLALEPGSPAGTLEVVQKILASKSGKTEKVEEKKVEAATEEKSEKPADVAADVADTAAKLDGPDAKL